MKLHFRNSGADSYSQGVTPLLIPGSASGSAVVNGGNVGPGSVSNMHPVMSPSGVNSAYAAGSAPLGNPATRRTPGIHLGCSFAQALLYVLGVVLVFTLPFAVPVAYSHAVKAVDRFGTTVRRSFHQDPPTAAIETGGSADESVASVPALPSVGQVQRPAGLDGAPPLFETSPTASRPVSHEAGQPAGEPPAASSLDSSAAGAFAVSSGSEGAPAEPTGAISGEAGGTSARPAAANSGEAPRVPDPVGQPHGQLSLGDPPAEESIRTASSEESQGGIAGSEPAALGWASSDMSHTDGHEPVVDPWIPHVEVENGKLLLSRTFESRLNADVAPHLAEGADDFWGGAGPPCAGSSVSFLFDQSPRLEAVLHVATSCGEGRSCVITPVLRDFRRTEISLGDAGDLVHYVRTFNQDNVELHKWGPLRGALKMMLTDTAMLAVRRSCQDPLASSVRITSVAQIRAFLKLQHARRATGPTASVASVDKAFVYNAHPHHHIGARGAQPSSASHGPPRDEGAIQTQGANLAPLSVPMSVPSTHQAGQPDPAAPSGTGTDTIEGQEVDYPPPPYEQQRASSGFLREAVAAQGALAPPAPGTSVHQHQQQFGPLNAYEPGQYASQPAPAAPYNPYGPAASQRQFQSFPPPPPNAGVPASG